MTSRPAALAAPALFTAVLAALSAGAAKLDKSDPDYGGQLPRVPALSPDEALKAFETRPGFRVELGADADGRRAKFLALVDAAERLTAERKITRREGTRS